MVEIGCLDCGKTVVLPQAIDTDNYDGQVVCKNCKCLLYVKLVKGKLRRYKIAGRLHSPVIRTINVFSGEKSADSKDKKE